MRFLQTGFVFAIFALVSPLYAASQCPSADQVRNCSGAACSYQQVSGWSESIFYSDHGKPFEFQKQVVKNLSDGRQLNCYYHYIDPTNNESMPPALVLRKMIS